jgi:hypothetical protein
MCLQYRMTTMINWTFFPLSQRPNRDLRDLVDVFSRHENEIDSGSHDVQVSDEVLAKLRVSLETLGFAVERSKKKADKIHIPVLFGRNGKVEKAFEADAWHAESRIVLEVEAGRAVTNFQFLKDLFQACMMQEVDYLAVAVRNRYRSSQDYEKVFTFFDTLYKSNRMSLPLKGVLIIGY